MGRLQDEVGASAVEYGLFLALIAAAIVTVVTVMGFDVLALYQSVEGQF
jgi:pilus assembly protein Flp/PilA